MHTATRVTLKWKCPQLKRNCLEACQNNIWYIKAPVFVVHISDLAALNNYALLQIKDRG